MKVSFINFCFCLSCLFPIYTFCQSHKLIDSKDKINLAGSWSFQIDSSDIGIAEQWYRKTLIDQITLPGSMASNNKGYAITTTTPWTGSIIDSSYFTKKEYAKYREPDNIKVPFWLQPVKYYKGAAWYQKSFNIPALWKDRHVELVIERSHWETTVWFDDKLVGIRNSLSAAQVFDLTDILKTGLHKLTVRIDNRIKNITVGENSHSISDHTQTNWNGMIGQLSVVTRPAVYINRIQLFPDIHKKEVGVKVWIKNSLGKQIKAGVELLAVAENLKAERLKVQRKELIVSADSSYFETSYSMGQSPLLWDEFHPSLYKMKVSINSSAGKEDTAVFFGMREINSSGTQFTINGRKTFLRGTLECAIFPKTGYPPTDVASWIHIFKIVRSYGLNHVRFHSWCPPEAAFTAADKSGLYLQIECASWANQGAVIGSGAPLDQYIYDESERIVNNYGNHPSFCMLAYGNEPAGRNHIKYLTAFVKYWKQKDSRRQYTTAAGWPAVAESDYNSISDPRIQHWDEGLKSIINREAPRTNYDWSKSIEKYKQPTISHEIGQWCVYPDFKEIKKYTGVVRAKNFEIFKDKLESNGLGKYADSFLLASGKLQTLCYKADIEAALRTPGFGGFQLLDLHDFPGQGTALVGVLNPFWEEKGYITGKAFSRFCNSVVPLARFSKMVWLNNEQLIVPIEIANFGETPLKNGVVTWSIKNESNEVLYKGIIHLSNVQIGNGIIVGEIRTSLTNIKDASKVTVSVQVKNYENSWEIFVYPHSLPQVSDVLIKQQLDDEAIQQLNNGGKVLLSLQKNSLKSDKGGNIQIGFSSIFWNTAWTSGQPPTTLGILCDPKHAALNEFPTQFHSNYQWWDAMTHSNAIILDSVATGLKPIVRVIDDWVTANSIGLIFECKVGKGKLLVSGIDLITDMQNRHEARQLMYSLKKYMASNKFNPERTVNINRIEGLFKTSN